MVSGRELVRRRLPDGRTAVVVVTDRRHGDLRVDEDAVVLDGRRSAVVGHPWSWLRQVHGNVVVSVDHPGACAGAEADALVTSTVDAPLAVQTADCAPVALVADEAVLGIVHAGWRGLEAGVIEAAVTAMRTHGAQMIRAALGPCIHAECYEFGADDLERLAERLGSDVIATTSTGAAALDLPAAVRHVLVGIGIDDLVVDPVCTACAPSTFSHRARADRGRQSMIGWIEP